jgi:hypothetical protein
MNVYLQFFTQVKSRSASELLRLPALLFSQPRPSGVAHVSAGGKLTKQRFDDVTQFGSNCVCNELQIDYDVEGMCIGNGSIHNMTAVFSPSPVSELWYPAKDFTISDRDGSTREMNASTREECLAGLGIDRAPSALEVVVGTSCQDRQNLSEWIAVELCKCVSASHRSIGTFGYVDFFQNEIFVRLESDLLPLDDSRAMFRLLPTAYPDFGQKFEDVHHIMFGSLSACAPVAHRLYDFCRTITCPASEFTVLHMVGAPSKTLLRARLKDCLLPNAPSQ